MLKLKLIYWIENVPDAVDFDCLILYGGGGVPGGVISSSKFYPFIWKKKQLLNS